MMLVASSTFFESSASGLFNWCQDGEMALANAVIADKALHDRLIR